jgi:hypothetical protein
MIQKSRRRLLVVGALMVASIGLAPLVPFLWAPAILLFLAGAYLLVWATLGKDAGAGRASGFRVA